MHYIRRMLLLLLALTPLGVCAQTQQSTKTERRSAMTDSVYRLTEVVVRSNQMLGSKFEVRNRTGAAYYISPEELGKFGYTDINRMLKWKSHATLTLLATQDCPLWLQYD